MAERLHDRPLSKLVLNAAVQATTEQQVSADGLELAFAVNHLAHFLIAERLHDHMTAGGRIVITASEVHDPERFCIAGTTRAKWQDPSELADPVLSQSHLGTWRRRGEARYSASKLLNVMHARHLAATRADLTVVSFNPSVVPGTDIARDRGWLLHHGWKYVIPALAGVLPGTRSIETSANDLVWLATDELPCDISGCYVNGRRREPGSVESSDPEKIKRLIEVSRQICRERCSLRAQDGHRAEGRANL